MSDKLNRYIAKGLRHILQPPALTNCVIDKSAVVCSGSHINDTSLGKYTYIGHDCFFVNVDVGAFCSIADNCRVGGATHPIDRVSSSPVFHSGKNVLKKNFLNIESIKTEKTIIGNDVWIGANALIKSGVSISTGAVIGMGSVVTRNVGAYEVWAGVPAKFIKKRFDDSTIEQLLKSEWWNWNDEEIADKAELFENVKDFIDQDKNINRKRIV